MTIETKEYAQLIASINWTLVTNLERLTLSGSANTNATGNTAANVLTGNAGNNVLDGGAGNDTYIVTAGDITTEAANAGTDTVQSAATWTLATNLENLTLTGTTAANGTGNADANLLIGNSAANTLTGNAIDQLWFARTDNNLNVSIIGTTDKFTLSNWYLGNQYHVEQFKTSDGKTLLDSQVQNLVSAMAAFAPPAAGQTTLPAAYQTALTPVLAANWQ